MDQFLRSVAICQSVGELGLVNRPDVRSPHCGKCHPLFSKLELPQSVRLRMVLRASSNAADFRRVKQHVQAPVHRLNKRHRCMFRDVSLTKKVVVVGWRRSNLPEDWVPIRIVNGRFECTVGDDQTLCNFCEVDLELCPYSKWPEESRGPWFIVHIMVG